MSNDGQNQSRRLNNNNNINCMIPTRTEMWCDSLQFSAIQFITTFIVILLSTLSQSKQLEPVTNTQRCGERGSLSGRGPDHDRKVAGSNPGTSGGRIFFSVAIFFCWLLFRYPSYILVTAVERRRSRSFCRKCKWRVTAKHVCTLRTRFWIKRHCKLVHGCMVYTVCAPRRQQFHVAPAM